MLDADALRKSLDYDAETGVFTWLLPTGTTKGDRIMATRNGGKVAGSRNRRGYVMIQINRKLHSAHRLAWLHVTGEWPSGDLDHTNGIKHDNRFSNLRIATRAQNAQNRRTRADNSSGYKGVHWSTTAKKWQARIGAEGERVNLGYFDDSADAFAAYTAAANAKHGAFARVA